MKNIPNILTLGRIGLIPLVVLAMLGGLNHIALFFFIIAGITDFFDGYLARKLKVESRFGAMLDPIADKLLVAAVLVFLARQIDGFDTIAIVIILLREVLVSGIREYLGSQKIAMPVTRLAKWKTALQFASIAALLWEINLVTLLLLWAAAVLTAVTGYQYTTYAMARLKK